MSTAYPFLAETLVEAKQQTQQIPSLEAGIQNFESIMLQLSAQLQSTLETDLVMKTFAEHAASFVPFDSIVFKSQRFLMDISYGKHGRNSCSYSLDLSNEKLGEIAISRNDKFTEDELQAFEKLICILIYPLRNSLLYQQALRAATKDAMTGLDNRRGMDERIAHETSIARRYNQPLSMLVIDIDHFKRINDSYGHTAGDCLIKALADIMKNTARTTDYTFRYGGEEFVMLLPNTSQQGAELLAERIRETVEETECICHGITMKMTISLGISTLENSDTNESLFLRADQALYQAKNRGRNQYCIAD